MGQRLKLIEMQERLTLCQERREEETIHGAKKREREREG